MADRHDHQLVVPALRRGQPGMLLAPPATPRAPRERSPQHTAQAAAAIRARSPPAAPPPAPQRSPTPPTTRPRTRRATATRTPTPRCGSIRCAAGPERSRRSINRASCTSSVTSRSQPNGIWIRPTAALDSPSAAIRARIASYASSPSGTAPDQPRPRPSTASASTRDDSPGGASSIARRAQSTTFPACSRPTECSAHRCAATAAVRGSRSGSQPSQARRNSVSASSACRA